MLIAPQLIGKALFSNDCPEYNIKQCDSEALILELWGMWGTLSLPLLLGLL